MNGADLRAWRLAHRMTQQDAAVLFGLDLRTAARIELNRMRIPAAVEAATRAHDAANARPAAVPLSEIIARADAAYRSETARSRTRVRELKKKLVQAQAEFRSTEAAAAARRAAMVAEARA